jgi:hypothetical protein
MASLKDSLKMSSFHFWESCPTQICALNWV